MPKVPVREVKPNKPYSQIFCLNLPFTHSSVIDGEPLRFRGEVYHPYHFNCTGCGIELTSTAREVRTRPGYTANELVRDIYFKTIIIF